MWWAGINNRKGHFQSNLWKVLIIVFVVQTSVTSCLVLLISFRYSRASISQLAEQLCREISEQASFRLKDNLQDAIQINQLNINPINSLSQLDYPQALQRQFWQQLQIFPEISEIYAANEQGHYLLVGRNADGSIQIETGGAPDWKYRTYAADAAGNRLNLLLEQPDYDPRNRPWYQRSVSRGRPTWSPVFALFEERDFSAALTHPVYDAQGKLQGVFAVGIPLSHLSQQLKEVSHFQSGEVYIVDRSGLLVATSGKEPLFTQRRNTLLRLNASASTNPLIQDSVRYLQQSDGTLRPVIANEMMTVEIKGQRHFMRVAPLVDPYGLDWLLVVIVPESEFTAQIMSNSQIMLAACLIIAVVGLLIGMLFVTSAIWFYERTTLKQQVKEKTEKLQQALEYEAVLKHITERVRDNLDEQWIFVTAVEALGQTLGLRFCNIAVYDLNSQTSTLKQEFIGGNATDIMPRAGTVFEMADYPEWYQQLLQGQPVQACMLPGITSPDRSNLTILACPMLDDQEVLGDVWLFKPVQQTFTLEEIQLAQQVVTQCAIALRQANLYQVSQLQVKELERLNHLKDDFLSTVSHELRAPMANIKMSIQMLQIALSKAGQMTDNIGKYLRVLQVECDRETTLINNLLDLARLESGVAVPNYTIIDLSYHLPLITEPFQVRAAERNQRLELEIPETPLLLSTDTSCLGRIISELLNNACKYTPANETIRLTVNQANESIEICITNTGVEIPEAERDRIFDKFYRIPSSDPWKHGGTGLGLALVKQLAEHLQGTISLDSRNGQTTFQIRFSSHSPSKASDASQMSLVTTSSHSRRVC